MILILKERRNKMDLNSCLSNLINLFTTYPNSLKRIKAGFPPTENISICFNRGRGLYTPWTIENNKYIGTKSPIYLLENVIKTESIVQKIKKHNLVWWKNDEDNIQITADDFYFLYGTDYIDYIFNMDNNVLYELREFVN